MKARFKATSVEVSIGGATSEAWLAAHLTNPFRDWADESEPFGSAACKAYERAILAVAAITPEAPDRNESAERVLRGFIADLNTIQSTYAKIDTIHREQAGAVFFELAGQLKVPHSQAQRWFDERDF